MPATSDALKTSSGTAVASVSYGYNADSEVTSESTAGLAGAASGSYTYDEAGRLTSWNNGSTTTGYGYDSNGNLTRSGSKAYTYDARDELTGDGTGSYAYTARGTSSAEPGPGGPLAVTSDAYGDQATAGTRAYAYDALGRLAGDTASAGGNYAFSYVGAAGTLASDGTSTYAWDPSGSVLAGAGTAGGGTSGVQGLTDSHGNLVGEFTPAATSISGSKAYDPWGNVTAVTGTPVGLLGFQSAWSDAAAGKDLMGARWYDPAAGDFTSRDTVTVSPDPDPAAGNPFAYAADEPLDFTDPTGHYIVPSGTPESAGVTPRAGSTSVTSSNNYVADVAAARVIQAAAAKAPTSAAKAAAAKAAAAKVTAQQNAAAAKAKAAAAKAKQEQQQKEQQQAAENKANLAKVQRMEEVQLDRDAVLASAAASQKALIPADNPAGEGPAYAPDCSGPLLHLGACPSEAHAAGTTPAEVKQAAFGALQVLASVIPVFDFLDLAGIAGDAAADIGEADASAAGDAVLGRAGAEDPGAEEPSVSCGNSFAAATPVLLASGKAVPISALKAGDKVLADDTRTGKDQPEAVTAVMVHHDTDLYDLTVKTSHGTEVIHTTSNHLFWDPSLDYGWIPAKHLKTGEKLKTPDGATVTVVGGTVPKQHDGWMWDLTVPGNNDHDFYVVVTTTVAVLVHNCPTGDSGPEQTAHGAERAADPSRLDPAAQADVIANPTQTLSQADGAQVYVQQVGDRYNVVVQGERGVITNLKNISAKSFTRLARNYGWTPN